MGAYQLTDRYRAETGSVFMTGIQALVRIPIEQLRRDRDRGRRTAALVSGYPGSPLGGFDLEMARALRTVGDLPIHHQPAVNEELGATQVMGSQLASDRPDARYDGVVGIWYGKAPGLDRAGDALRHGTFAGSSATGGALAIVGDDPAAKSSTMPSSSDAALVDLHMPILYPATVGECLELGLHGIAMSRATGLWSSLKVVTPIADGTGTVAFPALAADPVLPVHLLDDGTVWRPHPSAQFLGQRMVAVEQEFHEVRLDIARRYGIDNRLNRVIADPPDAWLGVIATGYTMTEVIEAFRRLGFPDLAAVAAAGIRVLHMRMPVPFDTAQVIDVARGVEEIFVVEEKNPTLEVLVRDALYPSSLRPLVTGKLDGTGQRILPSHGRLDADAITPGLRSRLEGRLGERLAPPPPPRRELIPLTVQRGPFFCSGCPHNWGTKVPAGSVVGMGTGCHGMTLLMDEDRVGESIGITAMGNEGAHWVGMAPFVETPHVFQNLGDGTYFHSAQLSIQQAVGAGVNITFKLLYNDTVAMTGGQEPSFRVGVPELARILLLQGVREVVITSDDPSKYRRARLPEGVRVHDRVEIVDLQRRLAGVPGVTVLIHDQACATEIRRARSRGLIARPTTRVVINHRICEGCGDCGDTSNCLSVQPVETELGRKTRIDQESCNLDRSCVEGDCPAFMTVEVGTERARPAPVPPPEVVDPVPAGLDAVTIRMAGIGGTGVVTVAQILGTASLLAGFETDGIDQTGLSQKAGPVVSDMTLTRPSAARRANLIGREQADVVLAFDLLVAAAPAVMVAATAERTTIVGSTSMTPTGRQVVDPSLAGPSADQLVDRLAAVGARVITVDTVAAAGALTGAPATANVLLLGAAVQAGVVPVPPAAVEEAIALNGVMVDANVAAFRWGRAAVADRPAFDAAVRGAAPPDPFAVTAPAPSRRLATRIDTITGRLAGADRDLLRRFAGDLTAYQDEAYAHRWLDLVERVTATGDAAFTMRAARSYHKLLAYKDEYEIARLMRSADGLVEAGLVAGVDPARADVTFWLHPPLLRRLGLDRKIGVRSSWGFGLLARAKRLRGTRFDPFGRDEVRRAERSLPLEFAAAIDRVLDGIADGSTSLATAVEIAELPEIIRGYDELKLRRIAEFRAALAALDGRRPGDGKPDRRG